MFFVSVIDFCPDPEPCLNNGTCTPILNSYVCNCLTGYTGALCQTKIDNCASDPCSSKDTNSTCINIVNAFSCMCSSAFTGTLCKTRKITLLHFSLRMSNDIKIQIKKEIKLASSLLNSFIQSTVSSACNIQFTFFHSWSCATIPLAGYR